MPNLLRFLASFVEDEYVREDFDDDPTGTLAKIDTEMTGEDVLETLEVIRIQVGPDVAARLDPNGAYAPTPRLVPALGQTPFDVAVRCVEWIANCLDGEPPPAKRPGGEPLAEADLWAATGFAPRSRPEPEPGPAEVEIGNTDAGESTNSDDHGAPRDEASAAPFDSDALLLSMAAETQDFPSEVVDDLDIEPAEIPTKPGSPFLDSGSTKGLGLPFLGDDGADLPYSGDAPAGGGTGLPLFADDEDEVEGLDLPFADDDDDETETDETDQADNTDVSDPPMSGGPDDVAEFRVLDLVQITEVVDDTVDPGSMATIVAVHTQPRLHYEIEVNDNTGKRLFLGVVHPDQLTAYRG